jgi:hypothetical protein
MLGFVAAATILVAACNQVDDSPATEPSQFSANALQDFCIKEVVRLSEVLADPTILGSNLSEADCDRGTIGEEGFFETWHVFADEAGTVTLDVESEFDSLLKLYRVTASGDSFATQLLVENDDVAVDDLSASIAAALRAGDNYLLRVAGFADEEIGEYRVTTALTDSPPPPPDTGAIEVAVTSAGSEAFVVTLNGAKRKPVVAGTPITYDNMVTGEYAIALDEQGECTVDEPAVQNISLRADERAAVGFRVTCEPPQGTLRMTTVTTAPNPEDLDDSYEVLVDGERVADILANDSVDIGLPTGTHEVSLGDVADNCRVTAPSPPSISVDVAEGDLVMATMAVGCDPKTQSPPVLTAIGAGLQAPNFCGMADTSTYQYAVAYEDPDGGIDSDTPVYVLRSSDSLQDSYQSNPVFNIVAGDGFMGTIHLFNCLAFLDDPWVDISIMIEDPTGLESNALTVRIDNPGGVF